MHQLGMLKRHSAPVITATQNVSVVENTTAVQTLTATHADGLPVTWSIVGGADSAKFSINSSSGALTFNTAPDFENPTDSGGNNVYDVTVRASDGNLFADQTKAITVTDATETVTRFVALGSGGARGSYSDDYGASWHDCSGLAATTYTGVCWGNGQFVAVAFSGTNRVATSPDGKTWTQRSAAAANGWEGVAYSPALGLYVAVSSDGTNRVMTSPDGITWTSRSASQANPWQSVAWSPSLGLFAAVAQTGTKRWR